MTTARDVQERLRALGYYAGEIDGDFGPGSSAAAIKALAGVPALVASKPAPPIIASKFDAGSAKRLAAAHPLIQKVMNEARQQIAFTVMDSQRGRAAQEAAFKAGNSKAHFGQSAHNWTPAIAVDIAPVPLDWNNRQSFIALSKVILPIAKRLGVPLRWGGDFNMDGDKTTSDSWDLPHYELNPWRDFAKDCKPFGA